MTNTVIETVMNTLTIREFRSPEELRANAAAWDDLWARSNVTVPLARAAFVAHWIETFAPQAQFRAVAVEQDGQLIAALPIVRRRLKGVFKVAALPTNHWASNGDLLLDPQADHAAALDALLAAIGGRSRPVLWFDRVSFDEPHWLKLQEAINRAGWQLGRREAYRTAQIEIGEDFEAYEATLASAHRRNCRSRAKALEKAGGLSAVVCSGGNAAEIDAQVRRGFEVEDRSWKGTEGTSVIKCPGMLEFYQAEARLAAELGHLDLSFLEHQGRAMAFAYTFHAKGTYFEIKLGYDDEFRKSGPGHLLLRSKLQRLFADPNAKLLDCRGPLIPWIGNWADRSYSVGRLVAAPPSFVGRSFFRAYDEWWPRLRSRLKSTTNGSTEPATAATSAVETATVEAS